MRLWQTQTTPTDEAILGFTVGDDPQLDAALVVYDCMASLAHARGLQSIGVLSAQELAQLEGALRDIAARSERGEFTISLEQEDCHTAIEAALTDELGDIGKKIHTGRSRNDQVIAALRLYVREQFVVLAQQLLALAQTIAKRADQHRGDLLPGYTHTRQGMPSSVGQLFASVAESLVADAESLVAPLQRANMGALGSASGYGVPLPLPREAVAQSLGLAGVDANTIFVQNTRGRLEAQAIAALHGVSLTWSRFAADVIWGSSEAFGFFKLPVELTTGSSIMPQKRNPDVLELVRAMPSTFLARYNEVSGMLQGLTSGYHRDLQRTKGPLVRSVVDTKATLAVMELAIEKIKVDVQACAAALRPEIYATDRVYQHVASGMAFRDAYRKAKEDGHSPMTQDEVLKARTHVGAVGQPQAPVVQRRVGDIEQLLAPFVQGVQTSRELMVA